MQPFYAADQGAMRTPKKLLTLIWQVTRSFLADRFGIFPPGLLPPLLAGHSSALVLQEAKD